MMLSLTACGNSANPVPPEDVSIAVDDTAWKTAYSEFLNGESGKFSLIYLNDDDIPEIAIVNGSAHANGVALYTYDDGDVEEISEKVGTYGTFLYEERGGMIAYDNGGNGSVMANIILSWDGSELVQEHEFIWSFSSDTYVMDGESVSESAYNDAWTSLTSDYKTVNSETCIEINEANIQSELDL